MTSPPRTRISGSAVSTSAGGKNTGDAEWQEGFLKPVLSAGYQADRIGRFYAGVGALNATRQDPVNVDLVTCTQGQQALDAVREALRSQRGFNIIFLDIRMPPGMDGVHTAQRIRELDPNVTIVFITACSNESFDTVAGLCPPPNKLLFFNKPFSAGEFVRIASTLCGQAQVHQEIATPTPGIEEVAH